MVKRIIAVITAVMFTTSLLSGCWDKVEIDQRGFIGVLMIDMAPPGYQEKMDEEVEDIPGIEKQTGEMIKVTYVFPQTSLLSGESGGGGQEKGYLTVSSVALSVPKTQAYVDARISRRLFFGHTQVILFGEELLKNPGKLKEVLDYIDRNSRINRTARVLGTVGEASKAGEVNPKTEKLLFRYIRDLLQNDVTNGRMVEMSFNQFISMVRENGTAIIPRAMPEKDEIKISGAGLIKDYKLIGYLSDYDTQFFNTLSGARRGGREYINLGDIAATFTASGTSRIVKLLNSDIKNLEIAIHVDIEGAITSDGFYGKVYDTEMLKRLEKEFDKMTVDSSNFVIKKLQQEFKVDALKMGEYLRKYHPSVWKQVAKDWDDIYPKVKITPIIRHRIRRIGETK